MKKIISLILVISMVLSIGIMANTEKQERFEIKINGQLLEIPVELGQAHIDSSGRTQVPARAIIEGLGFVVDWRGQTNTVGILDSNQIEVATIKIGSKVVNLSGGKSIEMDTEAVIAEDGRTYIPLRFVSQALGFVIPEKEGYIFEDGVHKITILSEDTLQGVEGLDEIGKKINEKLGRNVFFYFDENNLDQRYDSLGLSDDIASMYKKEISDIGLPKLLAGEGAFIQKSGLQYKIGYNKEGDILLEFIVDKLNPDVEYLKDVLLVVLQCLSANEDEGLEIWEYWSNNYDATDASKEYSFGDSKVTFPHDETISSGTGKWYNIVFH